MLVDPKKHGSDLKLIRRALLGGWKLPADVEPVIVRRTLAILRDGGERDSAAAKRVLELLGRSADSARLRDNPNPPTSNQGGMGAAHPPGAIDNPEHTPTP
jgi:hypothetical protein